MKKRTPGPMIWMMTLCVLNWMGVDYITTSDSLYLNHRDLSKRTITNVTTFIRGKAVGMNQKPYEWKTKAYKEKTTQA